jgi:hypothetical protein
MRLLLTDLAHQYDALLSQIGTDGRGKAEHLKWLCFYWDFCHLYYYTPYRSENLPPLLDKLREKRQSDQQRNQARHVTIWFYCLQPIQTVTSGVLIRSDKLLAISRSLDATLRSVVLSSNAIVENTATSTACSPILSRCDSKRPNHPDSYKQ